MERKGEIEVRGEEGQEEKKVSPQLKQNPIYTNQALICKFSRMGWARKLRRVGSAGKGENKEPDRLETPIGALPGNRAANRV